MKPSPKVKSVRPLDDYRLLVGFTNDVVKIYDCETLLIDPAFSLLRSKHCFGPSAWIEEAMGSPGTMR